MTKLENRWVCSFVIQSGGESLFFFFLLLLLLPSLVSTRLLPCDEMKRRMSPPVHPAGVFKVGFSAAVADKEGRR